MNILYEALPQTMIYLGIAFYINMCYSLQKEYKKQNSDLSFSECISRLSTIIAYSVAFPLIYCSYSSSKDFAKIILSKEILGLIIANLLAGIAGLLYNEKYKTN